MNSYYLVASIITILVQAVCSDYVYETKYFDTSLDHFSFTNNATFKLRYLINDTYWSSKPNAPIFFYAGNEGDITLFANNTGFLWEIAPEFKALVLFAEHRYYGQSLPFGNKSSDSSHMGYLSSSQALMDYVELLADLKKNNFLTHPVVVFGGSYGGMLAAWMRMKYPATVVGAIAASAPIWQFTSMTPCNAFNRVLTSAFKKESAHCSNNIRKSWNAINTVTETAEGKKWLTDNWKLCNELKTSNNVTDFKNFLIDVYGNLAMANYPYPNEFLAPLPAYPVKAVCSYLANSDLSGKKLLSTLFDGLSIYFNYTGQTTCVDYSSAYSSSLDDQGWNYQTCTEMVMPMCADGKHDMFEAYEWNFSEYTNNCYSQYKVKPQENLVKNIYGGKEISAASNIIFSNGLLDPWSSGGVLKNVSDTAIAVLIPDGAHHIDLRASNPADPADVIAVRQYYRQVIAQWIS